MDGSNIQNVLYAVVFFGFCAYIAWLKFRSSAGNSQEKLDELADRFEKLLDSRMKKVESRIANLETIVLEQERDEKFEELSAPPSTYRGAGEDGDGL